MMLSRREVFLLAFLLLLMVGGGYFTMFFLPINEEIASLNIAIENLQTDKAQAEFHDMQYAALSAQLEALETNWRETMAGIPDVFDDVDILRRLQSLVYHYVTDISISITDATTTRPGGLGVNGVQLRFETDRLGIKDLLNDIWEDDSETRILNYTISPVGEDGQYGQLNVVLYIEFLTIGGRS